MKNILLCLSMAVFSSVTLAEPELKGSPNELRGFLHPQNNIVSIREAAEERAYSDTAIVSVMVTTEDKLLSSALSANATLRAALKSALIEGGVDKENINSSKFSSSPQYGWFGKKPNSYKVINRLSIKLFDEKHLQLVAKLADQNVEVEFSATTFEHSKKEQFKRKVQKKALDKIADKKAFYEESLGIGLEPIGIADIQHGQRGSKAAVLMEEVIMTAQRSERDLLSSAKYAPRVQKSTSFDEVIYQADISVRFKVTSSGSSAK